MISELNHPSHFQGGISSWQGYHSFCYFLRCKRVEFGLRFVIAFVYMNVVRGL